MMLRLEARVGDFKGMEIKKIGRFFEFFTCWSLLRKSDIRTPLDAVGRQLKLVITPSPYFVA